MRKVGAVLTKEFDENSIVCENESEPDTFGELNICIKYVLK